MNPKQIREFEEAFFEFDTDCDGLINIKELEGALKKLCYEPTEEELKEIMKQGDTNGTETVDIGKFMNYLSTKIYKEGTEKEMVQLF